MDHETRVLDHGYVKLIETWGSDDRIIESARMSTGKGFDGWGGLCGECSGRTVMVGQPNPYDGCSKCGGSGSTTGDEKLLRFLYENKHHTPFEMAGATIEVQTPIFVFREWHRHRTQSYNEMSARYVAMPEVFYVPSVDRLLMGGQSATNKQGSGAPLSEDLAESVRNKISGTCEHAFNSYRTMIDAGVAKELARLVLPVNTYSRMRASANLRNWLGFLALRSTAKNPAAQWEIRQFADAAHAMFSTAFPRTMALFNEERSK